MSEVRCSLCGKKYVDDKALMQHLESGFHKPGPRLDAAKMIAMGAEPLANLQMTVTAALIAARGKSYWQQAGIAMAAIDTKARGLAQQFIEYGCTDYDAGDYFKIPPNSDLMAFLEELAQ